MRRIPVRAAALAVVFAVAALGGGLVVASIWPVDVESEYYAARVSLSPYWEDRTSIGTDTVVGSASAQFSGLAPGIRVEPRVKRDITNLVEQDDFTAANLTIGTDERSRIIRDTATGVAWRFALGAAGGTTLALLGVGLYRRGPPTKGVAAGGVVVTLAVCAATGGTSYRSYSEDRLEALHSTGLLELAVANRGLLGDIETRAEQASPYLRNMLALSTALQQEYAPHQIPTESAVKVLLVSDIHSANEYSLMSAIVEEQDIDVVIDSGDLLTFGKVEADMSGLYQGIASLDVPYVFVRGNHDASSPDDTRVLNKMKQLDNVVLLEPTPGEYQQVTIGGLRIAGFNDPRYYLDPRGDDPEKQHRARDEWLEAWGERPPPDLTVSHEPAALDDVPGQLRINGHKHVPDIEDNRIQVGTFTGAGTLRHFVENTDGELVGQPNSFDVLTFGSDCRAQTLTRYQFSAVISGSPTYDSLSMVNAGAVAEDIEDGRTCGGDELEVEDVPRE